MSATTVNPSVTLDVSTTLKVPMSRLVRVELRKMVDTKAGMWLLIGIGAITGIATLIFGLVAHDSQRNFDSFEKFAAIPQGLLLPVLGILLITQEWSQRTAMVTFTLEPHRGKIISAKIYAALLLAVAALVVMFAWCFLATWIFGGTGAWDSFDGLTIAKAAILQIGGTIQGLAYGLLLLSSAGAIVTYFVFPQVYSIVVNVIPAIEDSAAWIDFGTAQGPLIDSGSLSGEEWTQLAVTGIIWVVIPFLVGLWRVLRAEVK
jgi:ABC-2 type transport system permease protein